MKIYPVTQNKAVTTGNKFCHGIDLGTTYSLLAKVDFKDVNFEVSNRIPVNFVKIKQESPNSYDSIIYDEKVASIIAMVNGKIFVGNNLCHLKGHEDFKLKENIFYHCKVEMGIDRNPMYPEAVDTRLDMPYKVASLILKYIRAIHLRSKDDILKNTVITVPASFQVNQRRDTIKSAKEAGIELSKKMLIDEPNAAFLGYFNRLPENVKKSWAKSVRNKNILVIDFGGGTLDLSILNVNFRSDRGICIGNKSISRYNDLGGSDLDRVIAEEFLYPQLTQKNSLFKSLTIYDLQKYVLPQLVVISEKLKIGICEKLSLKAVDKDVRTLQLCDIVFRVNDSSITYAGNVYLLDNIELNGEVFDRLFRKIFIGKKYKFGLSDKCLTPISQSIADVIKKSGLALDDMNYVLYVGGSSFNPLLISYVSEKLIKANHLLSNEPDKLVVEGAAIFSYFYHAHGVALITPITSDTIGIRTLGGTFQPIIEKGQQLPTNVELPNFEIQSSTQKNILVPICVNGVDFPIGEIRCELKEEFPISSVVQIKASINQDKMFYISVYIDEKFINSAQIDNPFSIGMVGENQLVINDLKSKINIAKIKGEKNNEQDYFKKLIWKNAAVKNYVGVVEIAEEYIRRFDDQDDSVWNMIYCGNSSLGREVAAVHALKQAMELMPNEGSYIYNYSLILEQESDINALEYLVQQAESVKADSTVKLKIFLLKHAVNKISSTLIKHSKTEAKAIVQTYKNTPFLYSAFDKKHLLPKVFKIAGEAFSYVPPSVSKQEQNESCYLKVKNKTIGEQSCF